MVEQSAEVISLLVLLLLGACCGLAIYRRLYAEGPRKLHIVIQQTKEAIPVTWRHGISRPAQDPE